MVGMSRARKEEKKEQRKESEDLRTEVDPRGGVEKGGVEKGQGEEENTWGGVNVGIIIYAGACLINA